MPMTGLTLQLASDSDLRPIWCGILLPWKAFLKKRDSILKPFNAVRQAVAGIATAANPPAELASSMIMVENQELRPTQAAVAQSARWTWLTFVFGRRRGVPMHARRFYTRTMSMAWITPVADLILLSGFGLRVAMWCRVVPFSCFSRRGSSLLFGLCWTTVMFPFMCIR